MIRNFFSSPNVLGRLLIILLFVGGVVYAGAFDGFVVETQASGCCGGGTDAAIFSSSECCDDGGKSDCACLSGSECGECAESYCGGKTRSCGSGCPYNDCGNDCDSGCANLGDACSGNDGNGNCTNAEQ